MGIVRMGPPPELMLQLKDKYQISDFIETGTYYGDTAAWAASHFNHVTTIDYSREMHEQAVAIHGKIQNIDFIFGDSRTVLETVVPALSGPAIFWLDSHWSGTNTYGANDECPLVDEIATMHTAKCTHFLFIDDARLFASPPPRPHRIDQWPSIDQVVCALKCCNDEYYIVLTEDVIIAVPSYAKRLVAQYCQQINTEAWEKYGQAPAESLIKHGCRLIGRGLLSIGFGLRVNLRLLTSKLVEN